LIVCDLVSLFLQNVFLKEQAECAFRKLVVLRGVQSRMNILEFPQHPLNLCPVLQPTNVDCARRNVSTWHRWIVERSIFPFSEPLPPFLAAISSTSSSSALRKKNDYNSFLVRAREALLHLCRDRQRSPTLQHYPIRVRGTTALTWRTAHPRDAQAASCPEQRKPTGDSKLPASGGHF
jgi:hypothetical protein